MAEHTRERATRIYPILAKRGDRYGMLLLLLVFSYVISAFTTARYAGVAETLLFVATLALALRTSGAHKRTVRLIMGITLAGTATTIGLALVHATDVGYGIANIWSALLLLLTVGVILRRVLTMPTVSLQSIFGAVSAYMIIGLMFASIYAAISRLEPVPFFATGSPANTRTFQYFSFTTLTTLGYGDFTAGSNSGRAIAVMEAMGGQIFLATLIARLIASYRTERRIIAAHPAGSGATTSPPPAPPGTTTSPPPATPGISTSLPPAPPATPAAPGTTTGPPPASSGRPGDGAPRRRIVVRPRATRPRPVKWRSARRR